MLFSVIGSKSTDYRDDIVCDGYPVEIVAVILDTAETGKWSFPNDVFSNEIPNT